MEKIKLGDVASVITKGTTPTSIGYSFIEKGINFIKIESISEEGKFIKEKLAYISEDCNSKLKRSQLKENDILFSIAGAIGRVAVVDDDIIPANTNQALAIIRIDKRYDKEFLAFLLRSSYIKKQYNRKKQGVAQINLSLKDISELEIPVIDIKKQIEIKETLKKIIEIINLKKGQIEKLDNIVKSQFVEMFENVNYDKKCLNDISIIKGEYGSGASAGEYIEGQPRYVRITDIQEDGRLNNNSMASPKNENNLEKYILDYGDILFARTGATVGKTYKYSKNDGYCIYAGYCIRFRLDINKVNPDYIFTFTKTDEYKKWVANKQRVVAQPNINAKEYGNDLLIPIPPLEEQNQFAEFVKLIDKQKFVIVEIIMFYDIILRSILNNMMG